jgi:uncharacterized protein (DUF2252 family)
MSSKKSLRPEHRSEALSAKQMPKMARSAHAYVRGSTVQFYVWLEAQERRALLEGPPIWISGDCHAGNIGPVGCIDKIAIRIRDLDQTVIGNRPRSDPARSFAGDRISRLAPSRRHDRADPGAGGRRHRSALRQHADEIDAAPDSIRLVMKQSTAHSWKAIATERLEDEKPMISLGARFWPLARSEREAIDALFETPPLQHLSTSSRSRDDDAYVEVLDAASWMKGCSSLGVLRVAVLVGVGKGKRRNVALLDVKEAVKAAAPGYEGEKMPRNNAERVVQGAIHLSPHLGKRMVAGSIDDRSVFIRQLLPLDLTIEIENLTVAGAMKAASFMASVVGKAHARQLDERARQACSRELERHRSKTLDAPSWLWLSVVELIGRHEVAYLEHCRKYSSQTAAA